MLSRNENLFSCSRHDSPLIYTNHSDEVIQLILGVSCQTLNVPVIC